MNYQNDTDCMMGWENILSRQTFKEKEEGMRFLLSFTIWRIRIFLINFIIRIQTYYDCINHSVTKDWLPKWPMSKMTVHQNDRQPKCSDLLRFWTCQGDYKTRKFMTKMTVYIWDRWITVIFVMNYGHFVRVILIEMAFRLY